MSIFDRLDRMTSRAVDRVNAASFTCFPMKKPPNGRSVPDGNRVAVDAKGVLDEWPVDTPVEVGNRDRRGNDLKTLVTGDRYHLSVDIIRWPDAKKFRQGDRIKMDNAGIFEISEVRPDGLARVVFPLTVLSRPS